MSDHRQSRVIVVNLDTDVPAFQDFAKRGAIDLIAQAPDVWMWTVDAGKSKPSESWAEHSLTGWPRHFDDTQSIGEALAEAMEARSGEDDNTAIIFLATRPSALMPLELDGQTMPLPFLRPLGEVLEQRGMAGRVWRAGAFLCGPKGEVEAARHLIFEGGEAGLDSAVFLNRLSSGSLRLDDDAARGAFRLTIDILRNASAEEDQDLWAALKPKPGGVQPRALWLDHAKLPQVSSRPGQFLSALRRFVDERKLEAINPRPGNEDEERRFSEAVDTHLKEILAAAESATPAGPSGIDIDGIFREPRLLRPDAETALKEGVARLAGEIGLHYKRQVADLTEQLETQDRKYVDKRDEIEHAPLGLPGAEWSPQRREFVKGKIDAIEEKRRAWRSEVSADRERLQAHYQEIQGRPDPVAPGQIDLGSLRSWGQVEASATRAAEAAGRLKADRLSVLWVALPLLAAGCYTLMIGALSSGGSALRPVTLESLLHDAVSGDWAAFAAAAGVRPLWFVLTFLVAAALGFFWINSWFIERYRLALVPVREAAGKARDAVDKTVADAQNLVNKSRADRLAEVLVDRVDKLNDTGRAKLFATECEQLIESASPAAEGAAVGKITPSELDLTRIVETWIASQAETALAVISLDLRDRDGHHGFDVDQSAERREKPLLVTSTYVRSPIRARATPVRLLPNAALSSAGHAAP